MKVLIIGLLLFTGLAGCSKDDKNNSSPTVQEQGTKEERRIAELKGLIRAAVAQATERFDVDDGHSEISVQIEPMIRELQTLQTEHSAEETSDLLLGSWHQLWSNAVLGDPGTGPLADFVYQIILPEGNLWNLALVENGAIRRTELLRAQYIVSNDTLDFTYSKGVYITQWLSVGQDLYAISSEAEKGRFDVNQIVFEAGKSPIGIKATLQHIYIDDDFRINRSTALDGSNAWFIFEKQHVITK